MSLFEFEDFELEIWLKDLLSLPFSLKTKYLTLRFLSPVFRFSRYISLATLLSCSVGRMLHFQSLWVPGGCLATLEQVDNWNMQEPKSEEHVCNFLHILKIILFGFGVFLFLFFLQNWVCIFFFIIKIQFSQCNLMCCCPVKPAWQKLHWTAAKVWAHPFFIHSP